MNYFFRSFCQSVILLSLIVFSIDVSSQTRTRDFVRVKNNSFELNGEPYYFLGTNFWYGLNLGAKGKGGNRDRLIRELDRLNSLGIKNLRVMAGSEGPDTEPWRMAPALQTSPGVYNEDVLEGLDFLLFEMRKRDMKAVMCLNNFWPWSGGMSQYLIWAGFAESIPYPPPHPGGDWGTYAKFTANFYSNSKAMKLFDDHIRFILSRKNKYSNLRYTNDPTIMSWELANEPRGVDNLSQFAEWIKHTSELIKNLDTNHLVTTGSEGATSDPTSSGTDLIKDHSYKAIDYATAHLWVQNWGYYDPLKAEESYPVALSYAKKYIKDHAEMGERLGKPLVLEEFGISRDLNDHSASSTTLVRDKYYKEVFEETLKYMRKDNLKIAGCNFWAWGGEGRPAQPKAIWKAGDNFIGDPPHEYQGWYSVYDTDSSTISILRDYTGKVNQLNKQKKGKGAGEKNKNKKATGTKTQIKL